MTTRTRPRRWPFAATPLLVFAVSCASPPPVADPARIEAAAVEAHIRALAADRMEGRGTGTRGYRMAAEYVAAQFDSAGLEPAGANGTFLQPVPLREGRLIAKGSGVWLIRGGSTRALVYERQAILGEMYRGRYIPPDVELPN